MDETYSHTTVPDGEKRLIRAVLFSEWGIPFDKFEKYYRELEGKPFPFKKLGFSSLKECLESIPDVVRFEYSQEASKWILYAVADDKSFMSSFTRKKQLSNTKAGLPQKNRRKGRSSNSKNGSQTKETIQICTADDDGSGLVLSHRGLYSLIVRAGELSLDKEEFTELFKDTAPIAEVSSFQRLRGVYLFFRYKKKEDALAVIKKFNNYDYQGHKLTVKPAEEQNPLKVQMPTPAIPNTTQHQTTSKSLPICFDFKSGKCYRKNCKYLHVEEGNEVINTSPNSPRSSEGGSSSTSGSILPPPLLEDDDEDDWDEEEDEEEEGVDGSSFQESGPPPLESDSDSGGWSDEDESNKLATVTNGYHTMNSHNSLGMVKMFSPGRGRGLSQFR